MGTRTSAWPWLGLLVLVATGCASSADDAGGLSSASNVCSTDADCAQGAHCIDDMCIGSAAEPLMIHLEVSPQQYPSGNAGPGIWLPPFRADGPVDRAFSLPSPALLDVTVHRGGSPVAAELRLVEIPAFEGLPGRERELHAAEGTLQLELPAGARYALLVTPQDEALPPLTTTVVAGEQGELDIDYDAVALSSRRFTLLGPAAQEPLDVQAFDTRTGDAVSSMSHTETGDVMLTFAPGEYAFTLQVSPTETGTPTRDACSDDAAPVPTFRVTTLPLDGSDDAADPTPLSELPRRFPQDVPPLQVSLPTTLAPILYRGTVTLCDEAGRAQSSHTLPVSLKAIDLLNEADALAGADAPEATTAEASFRAATTASFDSDSGQLQFCVPVIPGDYEIVVSPPGSVECGIFAERRLVKAPAGSNEKTGDSLALGSIATVTGQLTAAPGDPVPHAMLDARPIEADAGAVQPERAPELSGYHRPQHATGDDAGMFSLPLDIGAYDLSAKPQAGSGFGWMVVRDVRIANRVKGIPGNLRFEAPVPVAGMLGYDGGDDESQLSLAGARVRAFTRLQDATDGVRRTAELGDTTVDEDGGFEILISPTIRNGLLGDL